MMRKIVAIADGGLGDPETLAAAGYLSRVHQAVSLIVPVYPDASADFVSLGQSLGAPMSQEIFDVLKQAERDSQTRVEVAAQAAAGSASVSFGAGAGPSRLEVAERDIHPWLAMAIELVLADLLVVSHQAIKAKGSGIGGLLGEALLQCRTPALITRGAPESLAGLSVIAWDGSAPAGRAIQAAIPLLSASERVMLLQCGPDADHHTKPASGFERVMEYLELQGVLGVEHKRIDNRQEGPALLAETEKMGAGLLVAGAYGHSRLQQAIFGGATRSFLEPQAGPHLLLAH